MKTETYREYHVKTEDWSGASANQGMPSFADKKLGARKKKGRVPTQVLEEVWPCQHLDFKNSGFQNFEKINFYWKPSSL